MFKRMLCLVIVLALSCAMALAEETDLQAQLDAANARIAELEAMVEQYKAVYDSQVIIEYDGGIVVRDEVQAIYDDYAAMFAQYGLDLAAYGMEQEYKEQSAEEALEKKILAAKAAELGADQLSEDQQAQITADAQSTFDGYVESVATQMAQQQGVDVDDAIRESAVAYLESLGGYTVEDIEAAMKDNYVSQNLYDLVTADVEVTEDDIKAAYDAKVAEQQASYADSYSYINARDNGELIVWNPEGYRAVKQVLIKFDDDQTARYKELTGKRTELEDEMEALLNPVEEAPAEEAPAEGDEPAGEDAEAPAEEAEPEAEPRTEAEINADLEGVQTALDELYAELLPTAQEVVDKYNAGTPLSDLIAEYNADPGMQNEPTATLGYAVNADNTVWDPAFTEGAMALENVGDLSEPIKGSYGYYIICYDSDITAGEVDYESVRDQLEEGALADKIAKTYNDAVQQWISEANPVRYYERLAG